MELLFTAALVMLCNAPCVCVAFAFSTLFAGCRPHPAAMNRGIYLQLSLALVVLLPGQLVLPLAAAAVPTGGAAGRLQLSRRLAASVPSLPDWARGPDYDGPREWEDFAVRQNEQNQDVVDAANDDGKRFDFLMYGDRWVQKGSGWNGTGGQCGWKGAGGI